jgi:hypothetical protein
MTRIRLKQAIFDSWINMLSYVLVVLVIMILSIVGLTLQEWHTDEYIREHNIIWDNKTVSDWLSYVIIVLILASIFLEMLKGIMVVIDQIRDALRKKNGKGRRRRKIKAKARQDVFDTRGYHPNRPVRKQKFPIQ